MSINLIIHAVLYIVTMAEPLDSKELIESDSHYDKLKPKAELQGSESETEFLLKKDDSTRLYSNLV